MEPSALHCWQAGACGQGTLLWRKWDLWWQAKDKVPFFWPSAVLLLAARSGQGSLAVASR